MTRYYSYAILDYMCTKSTKSKHVGVARLGPDTRVPCYLKKRTVHGLKKERALEIMPCVTSFIREHYEKKEKRIEHVQTGFAVPSDSSLFYQKEVAVCIAKEMKQTAFLVETFLYIFLLFRIIWIWLLFFFWTHTRTET